MNGHNATLTPPLVLRILIVIITVPREEWTHCWLVIRIIRMQRLYFANTPTFPNVKECNNAGEEEELKKQLSNFKEADLKR